MFLKSIILDFVDVETIRLSLKDKHMTREYKTKEEQMETAQQMMQEIFNIALYHKKLLVLGVEEEND